MDNWGFSLVGLLLRCIAGFFIFTLCLMFPVIFFAVCIVLLFRYAGVVAGKTARGK